MAANWHIHRLRVRYQETDQMAVVYHANYANWFEIGRTEYIRQAGVPYRTFEEMGLLLPVTELTIKFEKPALYDDLVLICTRLADMSPLRVAFETQVRRLLPEEAGSAEPDGSASAGDLPGELLVWGGTRHVWVNRDWKPHRLDRTAPALYERLQSLLHSSE
ncbi:acyl-CoA thioesterase [Paenibacillus sambharensis]|uniref:Acyl-CoA thioesterase n=1 Tax=Paenibacillus sambharensis TaxID=1803190 RepID=A0A2W1LG87_9BACL|nr:thioesterase family protein [Paenibacillus sambharensis]PZD94062.1 acyl-CoA thioesterase [Paenibacillus sambharensis]